MSSIPKCLTSPATARAVRFILDECLPPIIRDQRWFYLPIIKLMNRNADIDFRRKAPAMTEDEFRQAYETVTWRKSDMTKRTGEFVLANLIGDTVLEVGCGKGEISIACAGKGYNVTATDIDEGNLNYIRDQVREKGLEVNVKSSNAEKLPFPDHSFDVTICLNTLEHVRNLTSAISEIKRVTRKRVIIVVPKERYYRYTCNYHLNFFGGPEQLILSMRIAKNTCDTIDGKLCYVGDLNP